MDTLITANSDVMYHYKVALLQLEGSNCNGMVLLIRTESSAYLNRMHKVLWSFKKSSSVLFNNIIIYQTKVL